MQKTSFIGDILFPLLKLFPYFVFIVVVILIIFRKKIAQYINIKKVSRVIFSVIGIAVMGFIFIVVFTKPIIYVKTSSGGIWIFSGTEIIYKVYAFGIRIPTKKIELVSVPRFYCSNHNNNCELLDVKDVFLDEKILKKYYRNIEELVSNKLFDYPSIGPMFITSGKYYVSIGDNFSLFGEVRDILYEYIPQHNRLKKITTFTDVSVTKISAEIKN